MCHCIEKEFTLGLMFTKFEADRLRQNITYITTKDSGFRVSLPLSIEIKHYHAWVENKTQSFPFHDF